MAAFLRIVFGNRSKDIPAAIGRYALHGCVVAFAMLASGCVSMNQYVDSALPKVSYAALKPVEPKQSVQVFLEFRTRGVTNAAGTALLQSTVVDTLVKSKMFSDVLVAPALSENKLFITIDNILVDKDAFGKGFATGLTLGLAGSTVTDGYIMNTVYVTATKNEIKHVYRHAIHTTIGNADAPKGLVAVPKGDRNAAPRQATEGLVLNLLNDMSKNGEFAK
jgi:hypothetical protein